MSLPAFALIQPSTVLYTVYLEKVDSIVFLNSAQFSENFTFFSYLSINLIIYRSCLADSKFIPANIHILCIYAASVLSVVEFCMYKPFHLPPNLPKSPRLLLCACQVLPLIPRWYNLCHIVTLQEFRC